jgi:hypothetical protein
MSAWGGRNRSIERSANAGMLRVLNEGQGRALGTQERIITNCMAGRGYRTLDAPFVVPSGTKSPYSSPTTTATNDLVPALQPTGVSNWSPAGGAAPAFGAAAMPTPAQPLGTPAMKPVPDGPSVVQTAAVGTTKSTDGADAWSAERLPAVKACHPAPRATLSAKGPGFESYTVGCANGDVLLVRCEMGNCRLMR